MPGQLFTSYFLKEGILRTRAWREAEDDPGACAAFRKKAAQLFDGFGAYDNPNEAVTEQDLIRPLLRLLDWTRFLPQQGVDGNLEIPDHLLFDSREDKAAAASLAGADVYRHALSVAESKRYLLPLDSGDPDEAVKSGSPHAQILHYLATAEIHSDSRIRWGILTNGAVWRLYDRRARPRATGYHEENLQELLAGQDLDRLRAFRLLFGRSAFMPRQGAKTSLLEDALAEGKRNEEKLAGDLSGVVFERVYPELVRALAHASDADLEQVRQAALIFLYRVLFLLYAEDRNLLPVNHPSYDDYGLRKSVRDDVAARMQKKDVFSAVAGHYYARIGTLCRQIDKGDPSIGLPPYNGGLFAPAAAPLLEQVQLPDKALAPILYDLSHARGGDGEGRRFVNYRDMTVQQLGSIYERLLEREPARGAGGEIVVRPNSYARKDSGSFYTPQPLVDLIVERSLGPLIEERRARFARRAERLKSSPRAKDARAAELLPYDPAEAVLDLKVLDPAMGSGHFLVTAVDYLSDAVAELLESAPAAVPWLEGRYRSPLVDRIETLRREIRERAEAAQWILDPAQLTDQAIIRRMVLKRCIYGVDKNPLTVELAKVSLWLHSFTVGAPLSFLDHHLRCGDSLIGLRVHEAATELQRLGGFKAASAVQHAENAAGGMQRIEAMSDADISEVQESASLFGEVERTTAPLRGLLDTLCGARWLSAGMKKRARAEFEFPLVGVFALGEEQAFSLLAHGPDAVGRDDPIRQRSFWPAFERLWRDARNAAGRETFLHWEAAFPGVWRSWQDDRPAGGFDAVIGNPPWDRIKLQEVEWFATRAPQLALAPTAAARRKGIKRLRQQGDPLADRFDAAKERADRMGRLVRASGHYPLLGGGDVNLYSLFVERATSLARPDGIVGLLTPSGIYADKTAAPFFRSLSTAGRVGGLFDFENRRLGTKLPPFFPDVHSRFKFCALIFGGRERRYDETRCAFFLHDSAEIEDDDRCFPLSPEDFARVNPNTGTAPVFRTRRDADITRKIYESNPVLVDRSGPEEQRAWPVRYVGMFHMTNDSHLFRTAAQLESDGFYPVQGNRWKKGEELYLPLYEGKMVQAYDHRAASIVVNLENLNRPAQSRRASLEQRSNPNWLPDAQFWVSHDSYDWPWNLNWALGYKEITATTNYRTMIASLFPRVAFGNKTPIFLPLNGLAETSAAQYKKCAVLLCANFNSLALDFIARQKVHGQTLNLYIVEQLPVIAPADYDRAFGDATARELVCDHVLRLSYTSHDLEPFARDLGYDGPPFAWNEEERRHLRARLDALYFHLYGLARNDAAYVLDTFPILRRQDEAAFGRFRTKALVLAYYNALAAGDTKTDVAI